MIEAGGSDTTLHSGKSATDPNVATTGPSGKEMIGFAKEENTTSCYG